MKIRAVLVLIAAACIGSGCSSRALPTGAAPPRTGATEWRLYQTGIASWYGGRLHGGPTASGERFNQHAMTAAHRRLPFKTRVRVTCLRTGRSCIVRINDRGPFVRGRVIDLSARAAREIGTYSGGLARVSIEVPR